MEREYYPCRCRLDKKDFYFIWFSGEKDGVFVESDGKIPTFEDLSKLLKYASLQNISLKDENANLFDLDKVENSIKQDSFEVNCIDFLNTWNLFDDVSHSLNGNFDSNRKMTNKIYEKLFWGNNLPVVTPEGKSYEPIWSKKELKIMCEILSKGFSTFRDNLKIIDE